MLLNNVAKEIANSKYNQELVPWFLLNMRGMQDEVARNRLAKALIERDVFYVPFNDYFSKCFGPTVVGAMYEQYSRGKCVLTGSMVFPLYTIQEDFLGYLRNNPKAQDKYNYPEKFNFDKSRYLQTTKKGLEEAFKQQFICIVEGFYDEISVSSLGLPCVGLSGSELGRVRRMILDNFLVKIIISDRDSAGSKLYKECVASFHGKVINVSLPTKDIDQYLRTESNAIKFVELIKYHKGNGFPFSLIEVPS